MLVNREHRGPEAAEGRMPERPRATRVAPSRAWARGLIVVGGLFFFALLIFDRQALEIEPGDVDVFKH